MRIRKVAAIAAFAITTSSAGFVIETATSAHAQSGAPLVYVCPGVQNGQPQPCTNTQEFEVFDTYGYPIYSVGEFGGDGVFGANRSIYAPGNATSPALVESYTTGRLRQDQLRGPVDLDRAARDLVLQFLRQVGQVPQHPLTRVTAADRISVRAHNTPRLLRSRWDP